MKTRLPILSVVFIFLATTIVSQTKVLPDKNFFAIKTDLVFIAPNFVSGVHSGRLTFEKGFASRHSLQFSTGYFYQTHLSTQRLWLIPEYKYFFRKNGFKGFYTGIYLKYVSDKEKFLQAQGTDFYNLVKYQNSGGGVIFGFQTYIKKHLTLDFLVGAGAVYRTLQKSSTPGTPPNTLFISNEGKYPRMGIDGRFSINLGYKF